ncbi:MULTISPECIES: pyridoxal phosphate-dependent aminotransferase [unclassified Burkholderia]|uniref:pyridoxal phosphate-dependent aminotransferase n=1 Tax=unclassified Burkholderia TaxID=2613784 RepID=UPI000F56CCDA|nr:MULTISPECIES: pyridoxal phosphate-dependent aminotransferase [unclassified Burkholderia]RQR69812.1 pyridoxal phosphate-dependent aminotransferase [Burkholderia sp. Bp9012]RQR73305.1 pyridoxal phosphate-dependent aminotransferase [Burkholderia sp. Bp9011]RQR85164.1 pyridoxal phosphate-dependent aminotransferase [Burkholderia sp. Bp9010]RQZ40288.1 pyridoxal phosphate-dependent aminotransferase [Burkholderia sp. Bp9099]
MKYVRMILEEESPEELGYEKIKYNLSESSISDRKFRDFNVENLDDLVLLYGEHRGDKQLRELIAKQSGAQSVTSDDVLICNGAAGALFIIATSLLDKGSHLVVVRPNYATNIETPRAIGCETTYIDLEFEEGFKVDLEAIERAVRPNTAYISVTCPHNPTGTMMTWDEIVGLKAIADKHDCLVLVDETYRDLTYGTPYPTAATISDRFISVSSLSKAYGTPGIRLGWLTTRSPALYRLFLAAKEQIGICGSVVDEAIGLAVLKERDSWLAESNKRNLRHLGITRDWINSDPNVEWVEPQGGVVCFPRLKVPSTFNADEFYRSLLQNHHTYVGAGNWFEMSKLHMRIGFAWPTEDELRKGLAGISAAVREQL